jgi:CubicO group peptidase (beta-lactamase class C family)
VAILILQLAEEGKLRLSDKVSAYLPEMNGDKSDISIHQLLSHTSGLQHFSAIPSFLNVWQSRYTRKEWRDELLKLKRITSGEPGYRYSGPGYFFLALLVEKLRGMTLASAYRKYIFIPAGMKQSFSVEELTSPVVRLSSPYQ